MNTHSDAAGPVAPTITNTSAWLEAGCSAGLTGEQLYALQDLFTIYVHRSPVAPPAPKGSLFHGRDIAKRYAACCEAPCPYYNLQDMAVFQ